MLAQRLGCRVEELAEHGYEIRSAGVSAFPGMPASPEAILVAREQGADLSIHRSQPLTPEIILGADEVIVMTSSHAELVTGLYAGADIPPPRLLCDTEGDLIDPIGGGFETYRDCAQTIRRHLERLIEEWERG